MRQLAEYEVATRGSSGGGERDLLRLAFAEKYNFGDVSRADQRMAMLQVARLQV